MTRCPPRVKCLGVVPAVSHIMLHSDPLANEFNDILNAVEIFAPFQPLDPAVTFYAPLRSNVRDLRLSQDDFQRNSEAWFKDGNGIYRRAGLNRPRFEQSRLLMELASTNKCINYNANPELSFSGIIPDGSTVRRVYDPGALLALGLQDICTSGYVFELENETGTLSEPAIDGVTGNTNKHAIRLYVDTFGATLNIGLQNDRRPVNTTGLTLVELQDLVPAGTGEQISFALPAGNKVRWILNQLEESEFSSTPIVSQGTAGQRAADFLSWENLSSFLNQAQGMAVFVWAPMSDLSLAPNSNFSLLTFSNGTNLSLAYASSSRVTTYDGNVGTFVTYIQPDPEDICTVAVRWGPSDLDIGSWTPKEGAWRWSTPVAYAGAWPNDDILRVARNNGRSLRFGEVTLFNENRGRAWIEANYP